MCFKGHVRSSSELHMHLIAWADPKIIGKKPENKYRAVYNKTSTILNIKIYVIHWVIIVVNLPGHNWNKAIRIINDISDNYKVLCKCVGNEWIILITACHRQR